MLIRLAVFLLESSPLLRRLLWRWWYGRLAQRHLLFNAALRDLEKPRLLTLD